MVPKRTREYLHFTEFKYSNTLDQIDQLIVGSAFLIPNMQRVTQDYDIFINEVGTVTLKQKGKDIFERRLLRQFIEYAVDRKGENIKLTVIAVIVSNVTDVPYLTF